MSKKRQRPNILLIVWHDLGDWLGCYGFAPSPSPHLDAFAAQGTRLNRCFSSAPICCPSRAAMLSGIPPQASGMIGQVNRGWDMRAHIETLPGDLHDMGYETRLIGFGVGFRSRSVIIVRRSTDYGQSWEALQVAYNETGLTPPIGPIVEDGQRAIIAQNHIFSTHFKNGTCPL